MKISLEKFKEFFEAQEWSHTKIGASYGASQQTITNYGQAYFCNHLAAERRKSGEASETVRTHGY